MFQNPDVQLFNPTVFDEIAFGPLQLGWPAAQVRDRASDVLAAMRLSPLADRPPHHLSGGEKKRVALASVLVMDPDVLLLDEPTATLDPRSQSQVIDLLVEWGGGRKTVVVATHDLGLDRGHLRSVPRLRVRPRGRGSAARRRPLGSRPAPAHEPGPRAQASPWLHDHALPPARPSALTRAGTATTRRVPRTSVASASPSTRRCSRASTRSSTSAGYGSRSEAFRDLIRDALITDAAAADDSPAVGTITLVYDHHERTLNARLTAVQHEYHHAMLSTLHVHLDHDHCLEVVVVRGAAGELRRIADALVSMKGVKHGRLTITSPSGGGGR